MVNILIGNTFRVSWRILTNNEATPLTGRNIRLILAAPSGKPMPITPIVSSSDSSSLTFVFQGADQKETGIYRLIVIENKGVESQALTSETMAFRLVSSPGSADSDIPAFGDAIIVDCGTGNLKIGYQGDSAFESWLRAIRPESGKDTEADFMEWLRKPSDEAAAVALEQAKYAQEQGDTAKRIGQEISLLGQTLTKNEDARIAAEKTREENESARKVAETERQNAESARASAEQTRQASEESRVSSETTRTEAERERKENEDSRKKAENARIETEAGRKASENARNVAETNRSTAEAGRMEAEKTRVASESSRNNSEQQRKTAEESRVNAENSRVSEFSELKKASEEATKTAGDAASTANSAAAEASKAAATASSAANLANSKASSAQEAAATANSAASSANTATEDANAAAQAATAAASEATTEAKKASDASNAATKAADNANEAAAEAREVSDRVTSLERDLGQYEPLPSVAMTAETTGKYINADGEFVDDADFNIAAIGAVVVGNTYELYMGGSDKMKQGVALFVARIKTTTTSGTERIEYMPLFSAMSTDIAESGYVCFEAMEAYSDVLVCYRADVPEATTLLVRRYGTKASIATQINNLKKKVDLKSFADGYYASMRVGSADNLTSKGEATEELIMSRKAGGNNQIEDGSASIKRIKGYSVVGNQLWDTDGKMGVFTKNQTQLYNIDINGRSIIITSKGSALTSDALVAGTYAWNNNRVGHKYLFVVSVINNTFAADNPWALLLTQDGEIYKLKEGIQARIIETKSESQGIAIAPRFSGKSIEEGQVLSINYVSIIDLTQMFGSGNEPTTPDDFAKRLGYDSIDDVPYIPYNEGEIVSSFAEGIKTTDTEGKVSERKWSETLKKYFPDGLKSAGSAFDEITPTKAVKRVKYMRLTGADTESWILYGTTNEYGINNFLISIPDLVPKSLPGFISTYATKQNSLIANTTSEGYFPQANKTCFFRIQASKAANVQDFRTFLANNPIDICYELATPEETTYDELNLTEQVAEGGTEEAIITDGKTSTPLRADIVYPIDAYNTIKANKANIGTLSSLNTASKTDLVSAINELVGKVGALEAKAMEVTNETTE